MRTVFGIPIEKMDFNHMETDGWLDGLSEMQCDILREFTLTGDETSCFACTTEAKTKAIVKRV
jgi:hypothetical protein